MEENCSDLQLASDDLKKTRGIGSELERKLNTGGICLCAQLAMLNSNKLKQIGPRTKKAYLASRAKRYATGKMQNESNFCLMSVLAPNLQLLSLDMSQP